MEWIWSSSPITSRRFAAAASCTYVIHACVSRASAHTAPMAFATSFAVAVPAAWARSRAKKSYSPLSTYIESKPHESTRARTSSVLISQV
ncbi:hypothetical protein OV079_03330 [Nannocystis pusilla]|uniref:Uncharacterized protein n=1 Tax=Nannocystis pusilla TaxID=889268 RepID=A0A9X3IU10_9BACT|nr:hypothetical protein [Nannocystis pusilla]MCY1004617.1 hypothetical protein [Nannocystis pusilla]